MVDGMRISEGEELVEDTLVKEDGQEKRWLEQWGKVKDGKSEGKKGRKTSNELEIE